MNINNIAIIVNVHQKTNCQNVMYIFAQGGGVGYSDGVGGSHSGVGQWQW